jgi:hypothetical protein
VRSGTLDAAGTVQPYISHAPAFDYCHMILPARIGVTDGITDQYRVSAQISIRFIAT